MDVGWNIRVSFNTDAEMRRYLPEVLNEIRIHAPLPEQRIFDLRIILDELTLNALHYGLAPVCVCAAKCCSGDLHILVSSAPQNCDFDPCAYYGIPAPEQERGRGIFLAHYLSDAMEYNAMRNKVLVRIMLNTDE